MSVRVLEFFPPSLIFLRESYISYIIRSQSDNPCLKIRAVSKLHLSLSCGLGTFLKLLLKITCRYLEGNKLPDFYMTVFLAPRYIYMGRGRGGDIGHTQQDGTIFLLWEVLILDVRGVFSPTLSSSSSLTGHQQGILQLDSILTLPRVTIGFHKAGPTRLPTHMMPKQA